MPAIPESAPKPQDHKRKKSAEARAAEAAGYADVEVCGLTLRIPAKLPFSVGLRFRGLNDDLTPMDGTKESWELRGIRELLGVDQWSQLMAANPSIDDFGALNEQIEGLLGN